MARKVVACLGNPGSEYSTTRHNVGWWLADRLVESWGLPRFRREGPVAVADGDLGDTEVFVVKPLAYMNRSGPALESLGREPGFEISRDLLVVVDDVALEPGRMRIRAGGSAGGHNGLRSIEATFRTQEYARLRIGVGAKPPEVNLADWVLSSPPLKDRRLILDLMPRLVRCVESWIGRGAEAAMNECNSAGPEGPPEE